MADTTYRVLVDYNLETRNAEGGIDRLNTLFDRLKGAATLAFGVLGLEKMIEKTIELGSAVENTRIKLAGMMTAGGAPGASDFNQSLRLSGLLIDELREKSLRIPGTWQDLAKIVNTITVPGLNAGHSMNELSDMGAKAQSLFLPQGNDAGQISHSLRAMLSGHARGMDPIFTLLSSGMKGTPGAKEFNAMSNTERYAETLKALEKFDPAMKAFENSWIAVSTTTKNYAEMLYTTFGGGVFDALKSTLNDLNDWFAKNKETIDAFAVSLGEKVAGALIKAFETAKTVVAFLWQHKELMLGLGESMLLSRVAGKFGSGTTGAGADGKLSLGAIDPSVVAGGALRGFGMAQITGSATEIGTAMMTLEGAFSALTGNVGLVAKGLLVFHAALNKIAEWFDKEHSSRIGGAEEWSSIHRKLSLEASGGDTKSLLAATSTQLRDAGVIKGDMSKGLTFDQSALQAYLANSRIDEVAAKSFTILAEKAFAAARMNMPYGPAAPTPDQILARKLAEKGKVKNGGNTNINVKIEQTIENADDPERVMIKTREALDRFLIHPIETGSNIIAPLR